MSIRHFFLISLVLVGLSPAWAVTPASPMTAPNTARPSQPQFGPMPLSIQTLKMCAGRIPSGWIMVDEAWNPTMCGSPDVAIFNEWTLERFETSLVGSTIDACAGPVPNGWVVLNTYWDRGRCGNPGQAQNNMMTIKRIN